MKNIISILSILMAVLLSYSAQAQCGSTPNKFAYKYDEAHGFYGDRALVVKKKYGGAYKYGYINENGVEIIKCQYDFGKDFSDGLAAVKSNGKFGFIDKNGSWSISPRYCDVAWGFVDGKAWVSPEYDEWGLIDKAGRWILPATTMKLAKYDCEYICFTNGKIFDTNGHECLTIEEAKGYVGVKLIEKKYENGECIITALLQSKTPIKKITISSKDGSAVVDVTKNISNNTNGCEFTIRGNIPLPKGRNTVVLTVENSKGEYKTVFWVFVTQPPDPPIFSLLSLQTSTTSQYRFKVGVKSSSTIQSVSLKVNKQEVKEVSTRGFKVVENNTYDFDFEHLITLKQGNNEVTLEVTNASGKSSQTWTIVYTPGTKPVLTLLSPTSSSSQNYRIKVGVKSATEVQLRKFSVNGESKIIPTLPPNVYDYNFTQDVVLQRGNNDLTLITYNANGTTTQTWNIVYNPSLPPSKRIALVIGNSNYKSQMWGALPNPKNDANAIASALRKYGFTVILENDLPTKSLMMEAVSNFAQTAASYDVAMVYYAGHGCMAKEENYLIPTTAYTTTEADIMEMCMSATYIQNSLETKNNRLNIIVIDACRSTIGRGPRGPSLMTPPVGTVVFYSVSPNQSAVDGEPGGYSPFAKSFLKWIDQPNTLFEMFCKKVTDDVYMETVQTQRPWLMGSVVGEFMFNVK